VYILIADADLPVASFIAGMLESEYHHVHLAQPSDAPAAIAANDCDLLILDVDVSDPTGLGILQLTRNVKPHLPVLVLTGSARVEDRVTALHAGADDYLAKPFASSELSARVRALLRRGAGRFEPVLRATDLKLDRVRRIASRKGREIGLTPKEFGLLEYLMLNAGQDVSRSAIIRNVWKLSAGTSTNLVDVYVNYLRRKIDEDPAQSLIHTVRGSGYRIERTAPFGNH